MKTTKEEILRTALGLFAERGYDAVSTSMIAEKLDITKGALYRHFENKQQIFDEIWNEMVRRDEERAKEDGVPAKEYSEEPESYKKTEPEDLCGFVRNQFLYWTEDPFASDFRRMITIEQFKSEKSRKLYQDVIAMGPVRYTEDLFREMLAGGKLNQDAENMGAEALAILLFAPLQLMIQLRDGGADREQLLERLSAITSEFQKRWTR